MHNRYNDILDRIQELPTWFDDQGVPRYCAFSPNKLSNIYSREAALAEISCQGCGRLFLVALNSSFAGKTRSLSDEIRLGHLHYGDPPNVACCAAGPTMNSIMHRVLEYWSRDIEIYIDWKRDAAFEGPATERYEPVDTAQEVFAAVDAGQMTVCVDCTSGPNRYDVAGRVTVIAAERGIVLVTCPRQIISVVHSSLKTLAPNGEIGHLKQTASITLIAFENLPEVSPDSFETIIVLTGAPPWETYPQTKKEEHERKWQEIRTWLIVAGTGKLLIELRLAGRRRLIDKPDLVVDGWQVEAATT